MKSALAEAIRDENPDVLQVFCEPFRTRAAWARYVVDHFGGLPSVRHCIRPNMVVEDFHALYIACWIHDPVEKGSFMIELENFPSSPAAA